MNFKSLSIIMLLFMCYIGQSQSPTDAFMMNKKELCIALPYQYSFWDHYWEGTLYRNNPNLGTVSQQSIMTMAAYGIFDNLNFIAALPYISTKASQGTLHGDKGIQDLSLFLKGKLYEKQFKSKLNMDIMASIGYIHPIGGYYADYLPLSLGLGSKTVSSKLIVNGWLNSGFFASLSAGYDIRSNVQTDRSNYYTDQFYNTGEVKMPNMFNYGITLGYFRNLSRFEIFYNVMDTKGNIDIRRNDMPMLSSNMDNSQVGFYIQQRMPFHENLGFILNGAYTLSGRNVGKSTSFGGGILYQINFTKSTNSNN